MPVGSFAVAPEHRALASASAPTMSRNAKATANFISMVHDYPPRSRHSPVKTAQLRAVDRRLAAALAGAALTARLGVWQWGPGDPEDRAAGRHRRPRCAARRGKGDLAGTTRTAARPAARRVAVRGRWLASDGLPSTTG